MEPAQKESVTIAWTGSALVDSAAQKKAELLKAFAEASAVYVDISGCEDMDASGLQLLVASLKEARKTNKQFYIVNNVSSEMERIFVLSGISINLFFEGKK